MMGGGTVVVEGQEAVAVFQPPLNDLLHGVHTKGLDIVLKHDGYLVLFYPGDDVGHDGFGVGGPASPLATFQSKYW